MLCKPKLKKTRFFRLFDSFHREYSNVPYSGYYKFLQPAVNLRDADLIKDILIKDHFSFHINEQQFDKRTDPLMILNPFGARGDTWRKGRTGEYWNLLIRIRFSFSLSFACSDLLCVFIF